MIASFDLHQLTSRLRQHVDVLAQAPRFPGSRAHRNAQAYIAHHLQSAGFAVQEVGYTIEGFPCTNLVARMLPEQGERPLLVIGAHYDTVPTSPGADDNASAVAALLELARWIGPQLAAAPPRTGCLQLVAYDLEEFGFLGSWQHCAEMEKAGVNLRGMISLEMLGYTDQRPGSQQLPPDLAGRYPKVGNFIGIVSNQDSRELLEVVTQAMKTVNGLPVEFLAVPGRGEALPAVRLSDHSPFWDRGYPALMITDTSFLRNPHYHQPTDTPETLDYPFLAKVTAGVCAAVRQLLA